MIAPWYVMAFKELERVAQRNGYALAVHGSMGRDLDLIAIPWTEDAESEEKLVNAFERWMGKNKGVNVKATHRTEKPHGRVAYTLPFGHTTYYLDISIMPTTTLRGKQ